MLKVPVPLFTSRKDTDCGPLAVRMVASYFGVHKDFSELSTLCCQLASGMTWSAGLARAATLLGFSVSFYSMNHFSCEHDELAFYEKHKTDEAVVVLDKVSRELASLPLEIQKKGLTLAELLSFLSVDCVPIVLLNWNVVLGKEGFSGHFVPLVGYDDASIFVHNPGLHQPKMFLPIPRSVFIQAWESKGTDKDVIVVRRCLIH